MINFCGCGFKMASKKNYLPIRKEVLDDIASRFLINIPPEEKDDIMKVCDHLENAHWFYLDFLRPDDPSLPAGNFEEFLATIFNHCSFPIPAQYTIESLTSQWKSRKYKKPVRGAILLNTDQSKCLLVQGYPASTSWGFPKGKMNEGEKDTDAAVREVYEEVGFDIRDMIKEEEFIEVFHNEQSARMYIIKGISESTTFYPRSRKEIRAIQWFRICDLPAHRRDTVSKDNLKMSSNKFFLIIPFIQKLKKRLSQTKKTKQSFEPLVKTKDDHYSYPSYLGADYHGTNTTYDRTVPVADPYYQLIIPSLSWNSFELNKESVISHFRF